MALSVRTAPRSSSHGRRPGRPIGRGEGPRGEPCGGGGGQVGACGQKVFVRLQFELGMVPADVGLCRVNCANRTAGILQITVGGLIPPLCLKAGLSPHQKKFGHQPAVYWQSRVSCLREWNRDPWPGGNKNRNENGNENGTFGEWWTHIVNIGFTIAIAFGITAAW